MAIKEVIGKELMKIVWKVLAPWLASLLEKVLKFVFEKIQKLFSKTMARREQEAAAKAAEAHGRAGAEDDPIEAARQRGREEVWKEIAEHYKVDAAQVKAELMRIKAQAQEQGRASLDDIQAKPFPSLPAPPGTDSSEQSGPDEKRKPNGST
jgi:hypothetical protein